MLPFLLDYKIAIIILLITINIVFTVYNMWDNIFSVKSLLHRFSFILSFLNVKDKHFSYRNTGIKPNYPIFPIHQDFIYNKLRHTYLINKLDQNSDLDLPNLSELKNTKILDLFINEKLFDKNHIFIPPHSKYKKLLTRKLKATFQWDPTSVRWKKHHLLKTNEMSRFYNYVDLLSDTSLDRNDKKRIIKFYGMSYYPTIRKIDEKDKREAPIELYIPSRPEVLNTKPRFRFTKTLLRDDDEYLVWRQKKDRFKIKKKKKEKKKEQEKFDFGFTLDKPKVKVSELQQVENPALLTDEMFYKSRLKRKKFKKKREPTWNEINKKRSDKENQLKVFRAQQKKRNYKFLSTHQRNITAYNESVLASKDYNKEKFQSENTFLLQAKKRSSFYKNILSKIYYIKPQEIAYKPHPKPKPRWWEEEDEPEKVADNQLLSAIPDIDDTTDFEEDYYTNKPNLGLRDAILESHREWEEKQIKTPNPLLSAIPDIDDTTDFEEDYYTNRPNLGLRDAVLKSHREWEEKQIKTPSEPLFDIIDINDTTGFETEKEQLIKTYKELLQIKKRNKPLLLGDLKLNSWEVAKRNWRHWVKENSASCQEIILPKDPITDKKEKELLKLHFEWDKKFLKVERNDLQRIDTNWRYLDYQGPNNGDAERLWLRNQGIFWHGRKTLISHFETFHDTREKINFQVYQYFLHACDRKFMPNVYHLRNLPYPPQETKKYKVDPNKSKDQNRSARLTWEANKYLKAKDSYKLAENYLIRKLNSRSHYINDRLQLIKEELWERDNNVGEFLELFEMPTDLDTFTDATAIEAKNILKLQRKLAKGSLKYTGGLRALSRSNQNLASQYFKGQRFVDDKQWTLTDDIRFGRFYRNHFLHKPNQEKTQDEALQIYYVNAVEEFLHLQHKYNKFHKYFGWIHKLGKTRDFLADSYVTEKQEAAFRKLDEERQFAEWTLQKDQIIAAWQLNEAKKMAEWKLKDDKRKLEDAKETKLMSDKVIKGMHAAIRLKKSKGFKKLPSTEPEMSEKERYARLQRAHDALNKAMEEQREIKPSLAPIPAPIPTPMPTFKYIPKGKEGSTPKDILEEKENFIPKDIFERKSSTSKDTNNYKLLIAPTEFNFEDPEYHYRTYWEPQHPNPYKQQQQPELEHPSTPVPAHLISDHVYNQKPKKKSVSFSSDVKAEKAPPTELRRNIPAVLMANDYWHKWNTRNLKPNKKLINDDFVLKIVRSFIEKKFLKKKELFNLNKKFEFLNLNLRSRTNRTYEYKKHKNIKYIKTVSRFSNFTFYLIFKDYVKKTMSINLDENPIFKSIESIIFSNFYFRNYHLEFYYKSQLFLKYALKIDTKGSFFSLLFNNNFILLYIDWITKITLKILNNPIMLWFWKTRIIDSEFNFLNRYYKHYLHRFSFFFNNHNFIINKLKFLFCNFILTSSFWVLNLIFFLYNYVYFYFSDFFFLNFFKINEILCNISTFLENIFKF